MRIVLPSKLQPGTQVSLVVGGLQYDGTFLRSHDGVLQVRDPFEDSFIATKSIEAATISPPVTPCAIHANKPNGNGNASNAQTRTGHFDRFW
jgi:hypothetical protein